MTLKQFFQVAGGALVSLLFYSLPLIGLIKWPLVIIPTLLGIALAFLPLQDRPLERWLLAFFRSVYSPTNYFWKKLDKPQEFFKEEGPTPKEETTFPGGEQKLQEYLAAPPGDKMAGEFEKIEKAFLSGLTNIFTAPGAKIINPVTVPVVAAPSVQPLTTPGQIPVSVKPAAPKLVVEEKAADNTITQTLPISSNSFQAPTPGMTAQKEAVFSIDAAPPNPPIAPNTLSGQVIDEARKIIEGAILEVKDAAGRPVRALKSNKLGHFMVVTPLANGTYEIETEKEGFVFEPVSFEVGGTLIPPIAVSGKRVAVTV